jgi:hypothetical protein
MHTSQRVMYAYLAGRPPRIDGDYAHRLDVIDAAIDTLDENTDEVQPHSQSPFDSMKFLSLASDS